MRERVEDYPAGVRNLLEWARYHLEQLDILEREFRAWEAAQVEAESAPCAETLLLLGTISKAEQARLRWEGMRAVKGGEG